MSRQTNVTSKQQIKAEVADILAQITEPMPLASMYAVVIYALKTKSKVTAAQTLTFPSGVRSTGENLDIVE